MASPLNSGRSAVDRLIGLPGALVDSLRILPEIARHTATLYEITALLKRIASDTEALPVRDNMALVAEATSVLSAMEAKIATIEEAMPVLVEVQRHLDQLPDTMGGLDDKISRLSALMEQMLTALDGLADNVEALRSGMGPLSRLAQPGPRPEEGRAAPGLSGLASRHSQVRRRSTISERLGLCGSQVARRRAGRRPVGRGRHVDAAPRAPRRRSARRRARSRRRSRVRRRRRPRSARRARSPCRARSDRRRPPERGRPARRRRRSRRSASGRPARSRGRAARRPPAASATAPPLSASSASAAGLDQHAGDDQRLAPDASDQWPVAI